MNTVTELLAPVELDLENLLTELRTLIGAGHPILQAAAEHLFSAGGKRIRPGIVLLISSSTVVLLPLLFALRSNKLSSKVKLYPQEKWQWGWNNSSEVWNGRVAMVVFLLLLFEIFSGNGTLHLIGLL